MRLALVIVLGGCGGAVGAPLEGGHLLDGGHLDAAFEVGPGMDAPISETGPGPDAGAPDAWAAEAGGQDAALEAEAAPTCVPPNGQNCKSADLSIIATVCAPPRCVQPGGELLWTLEPCPGNPYAPPCVTGGAPDPNLTMLGQQCNMMVGGACYDVELIAPQ